MHEPAVRAVGFESRKVYQSKQQPSYTSWVSFFPGERGQWYLTCEEVTLPAKPLPQCSRQHWYEMVMPVGYDKSQHLMEMVMLESKDDMKTWHEVCRLSHEGFQHSGGSYANARTADGRFLRFVWPCYSPDLSARANEILYESSDDGKTWEKMPAFHDDHFVSYPHRLRTLRDGTLVLAVPFGPKWGPGTDSPTREGLNLNAVCEHQMMLYFSYDQGRKWEGPLPIYGGQYVHETDFVELPEGHLLCINNSIFTEPGRQMVYRDGRTWTPGPLERSQNVRKPPHEPLPEGTKPGDCNWVPETVCLTEGGILVGCIRNSLYQWSDDYGLTWQPLEGAPDLYPEMYQPWIHYLGNGRIVCAGHYGADDPLGQTNQYVVLHSFNLEVLRKTKATRIDVERDFDEARNRYLNAYAVTLTSDEKALADKELEFWYVMRYQPGYNAFNSVPLEERMKMGGKIIKARTDRDGKAHVAMPDLDKIDELHMTYQFVVRFNADRSDPDYRPAQTRQLMFYAKAYQDLPLIEQS